MSKHFVMGMDDAEFFEYTIRRPPVEVHRLSDAEWEAALPLARNILASGDSDMCYSLTRWARGVLKGLRFWPPEPSPETEKLLANIAEKRRQMISGANPEEEAERFFGTYQSEVRAMKRLKVAKEFFNSVQHLRQLGRADWAGVQPDIALFEARLRGKLRKMGIPVWCHCARRTAAEQRRLFKEGRSKIKGPKAAHTVGAAVDIVHGRFAWQMTKDEWATIGIIGKRVADTLGIEVEWGGDWSFYDPAHWQLADWKRFDVIQGDPAFGPNPALSKAYGVSKKD